MANFQQFISDLITEVSYRTTTGIVDFKNPDHISILSEVLDEIGLIEIKHELFENLFEADKRFSNPILNREIEYTDAQGNTKTGLIGNLLRNPKESPGRQAAERQLPPEGSDARNAINQELGSEKDGKTDTPSTTSKGGEQQPAEQPQTGQSVNPSTKAGKTFTDNLPKGDVAYTGDDDKKGNEPKPKNKNVSNVDTKSSEVYTETNTGISDDEFKKGPAKPIFKNQEDELKSEDLDEYFKSGKIPMKYKTVIARLVNTQKGSQQITDYMSGVGAGQLQSQAGEILTMASVGMDDDEFEGFIKLLEDKIAKYPKGTKPVITKDWLESVRNVRAITKKRYDSEFGEGNWEVEATAWDVEGEFVALGNDNYKENKGFSSDMYVKVKVGGRPVLDEISLKKDSNANIYNGVVTDIKNWSSNVPKKADINEYKKGEIARPTQYGRDAQTLQLDKNVLTSNEVLANKELRITLQALGVVKGDAKKGYTLDPKAEEIIDKLQSMPIPPPVDLERFKQVFGTGDKTRFKKFLIMHAACQRAKEISEGNTDKTTAFNFLNNHLGYEKGEDGKFPEGSIKRYQNDTIQFLVEDEEAKEGCLTALAEKLPMKALLEGEEKMAIGGLSADPKTLERVFGISSYDDFKAGLTMKEDEDGNNFLVYESKGPPAKSVPIAIVKVRQKGQGYASSVGLEFEIATEFAQELYSANKEEYPPEPEISDKERRKLGVA
jgi:hypothetical protein